jgi:hypothetical protein
MDKIPRSMSQITIMISVESALNQQQHWHTSKEYLAIETDESSRRTALTPTNNYCLAKAQAADCACFSFGYNMSDTDLNQYQSVFSSSYAINQVNISS